MDNLRGHNGVEKTVENSKKQTVPDKEAPKVLPWVHIQKFCSRFSCQLEY